MKIEIFEIKTRSIAIKGKDGKADRTIYKQEAFMYNGGRFPVPFEVGIPEPREAYAPGLYDFTPDSYKVDEYKGVSFDKYNVLLQPVNVPGFGGSPASGVKNPLDKAA